LYPKYTVLQKIGSCGIYLDELLQKIFCNFDYKKIQKEIEGKTGVSNLPPAISDKKIKKDRALRIGFLNKKQITKLIVRWLDGIDWST
jgi:hypothetical protein